MVKTCSYKLAFFLILSFISIKKTSAQGDVLQFVQAGKVDAGKLAQAYLHPFFRGVGYGMNSAWFNSARAKAPGRFDLRIQATGAIVPISDRTFDINKLNLSNVEAFNATTFTPTAFGNNETGATVMLKNDNSVNFNLPPGTGINMVPSPQVQLTIGLVKESEISLRYTPKVGGDNYGKVSSWGIGLKKEITKLLPWKTEKVIPIDLAIAVGYNQINYDYNIAIHKQVGEEHNINLNQRLEARFYGYNIDAILSKKLSFFTPFVSVGYNNAKSNLGILGEYRVMAAGKKIETLTDPVSIKQNDISGMRANIGFALHLFYMRLYGSYSIGEYRAVTAGIGLGIGK